MAEGRRRHATHISALEPPVAASANPNGRNRSVAHWLRGYDFKSASDLPRVDKQALANLMDAGLGDARPRER